MVIARNEKTGQTGVFPVAALMTRMSPSMLWVTLENAQGDTSRLGVTSEHPMFVAGQGWLKAGELSAGDAIRDANLRPLSVVAITADSASYQVHNLEVADAHTYFAGELEAWGHNAKKNAGSRTSCGCKGGQPKPHGFKKQSTGKKGDKHTKPRPGSCSKARSKENWYSR